MTSRKASPARIANGDSVSTLRDAVPVTGQVLRRAREHYGLSLREVERRTGRSSAYLSQVERGLIRQPDPLVLLELANLYKLNFLTLAKWAGWAQEENSVPSVAGSTSDLIRTILELDPEQHAELLLFARKLLQGSRK